jgi:AP-4 complex subunit mu-1
MSEGFAGAMKRGVGPINLNFTIPMYCASRLQVRYLQIMKAEKNYSPYRWVRYVTMSNSYIVRN